MPCLRFTVRGDVQGVGFRYTLCHRARLMGLTGWVRNDDDGSVSVLAEGPADRLRAFLDWCYTGVRSARVAVVESEWERATGEFHDFSILR